MGYLVHSSKPDSVWGCCRECVNGSSFHGPKCEGRFELPPPPPPADKSKERAPKRPQAHPKAHPQSPPPSQKSRRLLSPMCQHIKPHKEGEPKRRKPASPPPNRKLANLDTRNMTIKNIDGMLKAVTADGQIVPGILKFQELQETADGTVPDCTDPVPGEAAANSDHEQGRIDPRVTQCFSKSAGRCSHTSVAYEEHRIRAREPRLRSRQRHFRSRSSKSVRRKKAPRKKEEKRRESAETRCTSDREDPTDAEADYGRARSPTEYDRKRPPKRSVRSGSRRRRSDRSRGRRSPQ